jgi:hypothetical protein
VGSGGIDSRAAWEECFTSGLKHVFEVYRGRAGPHPMLEEMLPDLYNEVIPRLVRLLVVVGSCSHPSCMATFGVATLQSLMKIPETVQHLIQPDLGAQ